MRRTGTVEYTRARVHAARGAPSSTAVLRGAPGPDE